MRPDARRSKDLKRALLGIWWLVSRVDVDASGQRHIDPALGADPLGIVCFSESSFAAQYMKRDRATTEGPTGLVRGSNVASVLNGYDGHFGTYEVDEAAGILRVKLEGAISPADIGREFERDIKVQRAELTIALSVTRGDGVQVRRTLTFHRLAACTSRPRGHQALSKNGATKRIPRQSS